jgi:hypothetical protein
MPGAWDLVSPYGYAGAWAPEGVSADQWRRFREMFREDAAARGAVAEFLRLGSLVPGQSQLLEADPGLEVSLRSETVLLDVTPGVQAMWHEAQGPSRTATPKAREAGFGVTIRPAAVGDLGPEGGFRALYEATMRRVSARPYYCFDQAYYDRLLAGLGPRLHLAEARRSETGVETAALFMEWEGLLHYHLAGSTPDASRLGANNLMIHAVMDWAFERGLSGLHLGGGVRPGDGLWRFKTGFGSDRLPFVVARSVLRADSYGRLVDARAEATGRSRADLVASGYFPAYRA